MRRKEIRVQTLVLVAAVTGIIGFAIFAVITRSGTLVPKPSLLSGVLLVVMGGLVLWLARPVRRYLQGARRPRSTRCARHAPSCSPRPPPSPARRPRGGTPASSWSC